MATYLFSGFTESDLTEASFIGMGDDFTVPGATTHSFRVEDDDDRMSGDTINEGHSDDHSQTTSIRRGTTDAGSGTIYLDEIYTLQDDAGNLYTMYELEMEGTSEDFYVFQDPPPAPGTHLTVVGIEDANAGEVSYDQFAGDDSFDENDKDVETVYGGAGHDTIEGTRGDNSMFGGTGDDTLTGGDGADHIDGGAGNDSLYGGAGNDLLHGRAGDDTIFGGAGDDKLIGGNGSDTLHGGEGDDALVVGGATDDGIASTDAAYGGAGDDTFMPSADFDDATIVGGETGETHGDTIDLGATRTFAHGDTHSSPVRDYTLDLTGADAESGTITNSAGTGIWTYSEIENIRLGAGTETLRLANGSGDDRVIGFEAPRRADDGSYSGGDRIDVTGMTDADGYQINTADVTVVDNGAGNARLEFPGGETLTLVGVAPAEVSSPAALAAMGIPSADGTVEGTAGDDVINADYKGDPDGDRVDGGDSVTTPGGDDDVIMAGAGNDRISSGAGNDTVYGGTGRDTIKGGSGDDRLYGGHGSDRFVLTNGFGTDDIHGGEDLDHGDRDTIDASALSGGVDVTFADSETGHLASGTDSASFDGIEAVEGSAQADRMDASATRSGTGLSGGGGDDEIIGGAGADELSGGAGNDTLTGGRGADRIDGGAGNDEIHIAHGDEAMGGTGDDTFFFDDLGETGAGDTTVAGGDGFDTLDLRSASQFETLSMISGPDGLSGSVLMNDGSTLRFSQMERVICFTAGTRIATPFGPRRAEDLAVGDLVLTRDNGPQPLRWAGSRRTAATGHCAPIRIRPGVLHGLQRDLRVSPQHRMLFEGYRAQLLFGEDEVLVAARHLVDGHDVSVEEGGEVTYIHLLFDAHEIVTAEGAATESFQPGLRGIIGLDGPSRARLLQTCPGLRSAPDAWGPSARPTLRAHEARALLAAA
ncbi:Hint domain-containing protein [uncultured Limimaricola sp.]|uniref:Hint domain-containing protein n=1 Tax=uncultured Limimaricola sp. TaxID=2211667 RepID=UPI0030FA294C